MLELGNMCRSGLGCTQGLHPGGLSSGGAQAKNWFSLFRCLCEDQKQTQSNFRSLHRIFASCRGLWRKLPGSPEGARFYVSDCRELNRAQIELGNRSIAIELCHLSYCLKLNCQKLRDPASRSDCCGSVCQPVRVGNGWHGACVCQMGDLLNFYTKFTWLESAGRMQSNDLQLVKSFQLG